MRIMPDDFTSIAEVRRRASLIWHLDADERLLNALSAGKVLGFLQGLDGEPRPLQPDFWNTPNGRVVFNNGGSDGLRPRIGGVLRLPSEKPPPSVRLIFDARQIETFLESHIARTPPAPTEVAFKKLGVKRQRGAPKSAQIEQVLNRFFPDGLPQPFDYVGVRARLAKEEKLEVGRSTLARVVSAMCPK